MKHLQIYNRIDEQGRYRGFDAFFGKVPKQANTHGFSYLHMRKMHQEMGDVMGLDRLIKREGLAKLIDEPKKSITFSTE